MKDVRQLGRGAALMRCSAPRLNGAGIPVVDLQDGVGRASVGSPVPMGGGSDTSFVYWPPAENSDVVTTATEGAFAQAVPTGGGVWPPRISGEAGFVADPPSVAPDEDYPFQPTPGAVAGKHAGVSFLITAEGELVVASAKEVRLQLEQGTPLRISQAGDASEFVPL